MGNGCYDWKFGVSDVSNVIGNQQLRSAVIHAVLLKPYELEQVFYQDKGCFVHEYVRGLGNSNTENLIKESIISSVKRINGIVDANVELNYTDGEVHIPKITLIKVNGEEVNINAI